MADVAWHPDDHSKLLWCGGSSQNLRKSCCCKCTVTFNRNTTEGGTISSTGGSSACHYSSTAETKSSWIFKGWYDDSTLKQKTAAREVTVDCENGEKKSYTAIFVKNNTCYYQTKVECDGCPTNISPGTISPSSGAFSSNATFTFTPGSVSGSKIWFDGWYTRDNGSHDTYQSSQNPVTFGCWSGNSTMVIAKCHYEQCEEGVTVTVNAVCSSSGASCDSGCGACTTSGTTTNCDGTKYKKGTTVFLHCSNATSSCNFEKWSNGVTVAWQDVVANSNMSFTGYIKCNNCSGDSPGGCTHCGSGRKWYKVWATGTGVDEVTYSATRCINSCKKSGTWTCGNPCAVYSYTRPSAPHVCESSDSDHFSCID